MYDSE
jgi:hypothetical protein